MSDMVTEGWRRRRGRPGQARNYDPPPEFLHSLATRYIYTVYPFVADLLIPTGRGSQTPPSSSPEVLFMNRRDTHTHTLPLSSSTREQRRAADDGGQTPTPPYLYVLTAGVRTNTHIHIRCRRRPGNNNGGQLGLEDRNPRGSGIFAMGDELPFVDLGTGQQAIAVAAGFFHTCALLETGDVKCWGGCLVGTAYATYFMCNSEIKSGAP